MVTIDQNKPIIFYDGDCGFCHASIQQILKRDKNHIFYYAPLQGKSYQHISQKRPSLDEVLSQKRGTLVLFWQSKFLLRSNALIEIANQLGGPYKFAKILLLIPRFIRDAFYSLIARNRHKIGFLSTNCLVLNDQQKRQFLD